MYHYHFDDDDDDDNDKINYEEENYESNSDCDESNEIMTVLDALLDFAIDNKTNEFEIDEFLNYDTNFNYKILRESIMSTKNFFKITDSKIYISKQVK